MARKKKYTKETVVDDTPTIGDMVIDEITDEAPVDDIVVEKESTPVVPEEDKVEETPVVPEEDKVEEKESTPVSAMLAAADVEALLSKPGVSIADKLVTIKDKAIPMFKHMTAKLIGYNDAMGTGMVDASVGAAKQFDLLNTIVSIVETKEYNDFKIKFDILNLIFLNYKDSAFNVYKLHRFSEKWNWSNKQLVTLQKLATTISLLAPLATRKQNLKKIDIGAALDSKLITLSDNAIANIEKYYKA